MLCEKDLEKCLKESYRMPKTTDYSKCQIYKIVCKDPKIKDCYVGNTCNWIKRKSLHKHSVNHESNKGHNNKKSVTIRNNGGWENWEMVLIENFPCKNDLEARSKEREWFEKLGATMNSRCPMTTKEEKAEYNDKFFAEYRQENREKIAEYKAEYRQANREELNAKCLERNSKRMTCGCGVEHNVGDKSRHLKSAKHIAWERDIDQEFNDRLDKEMDKIIDK